MSAGANPGGVRAPPAGWLAGCGCGRTHVGDDGDEGVRDGEGEALWRPRLEALLHQGETVLAAEQADVAQQVQGNLHVLGKGHMTRLNGLNKNYRVIKPGKNSTEKGPVWGQNENRIEK